VNTLYETSEGEDSSSKKESPTVGRQKLGSRERMECSRGWPCGKDAEILASSVVKRGSIETS